jgi:hypothetical protein
MCLFRRKEKTVPSHSVEVFNSRGMPQGYKKSLEERLYVYETALCHLSSSVPGQVDSAIGDLVNDPRKVPSETALQEWKNSPMNKPFDATIWCPMTQRRFFHGNNIRLYPYGTTSSCGTRSPSRIDSDSRFLIFRCLIPQPLTFPAQDSKLTWGNVVPDSMNRSNEKSVERQLRLLPSHAAQAKLLEIYFADSHPYLRFLDCNQCLYISTYMLFSDSLSLVPPPLPPESSNE